MTTLKELGEMLIEVADNGREIQLRDKNKLGCGWSDLVSSPAVFYFETDQYEYRLKPKVTYYRVYLNLITSEIDTLVLGSTFLPKETMNGDCEWIHDFEVES